MSTSMPEAAEKIVISTTNCKVTNHSMKASAAFDLTTKNVRKQVMKMIEHNSNRYLEMN